PAAANLVSGNGGAAIAVTGVASTGNRVQGNLVGTNAAGTGALGNGAGVLVSGAPGNTIGGMAPGAGNVLSASQFGVDIQGRTATGNVVQGNRIGTNAAGTAPLANVDGISLISASYNTVGGTTPDAGNLLSGNNAGVAIYLDPATPADVSTGNVVQGNTIGMPANR